MSKKPTETTEQKVDKLKDNPAFYIPLTELPHYFENLTDKETKALKKAIKILTKQQLPKDRLYFLGELALMTKPVYAPKGLFHKTINPLKPEAEAKPPKYEIPKTALKLINALMEKNGFGYGAIANYKNLSLALEAEKGKAQPSGVRRIDAMREEVMEGLGSRYLSQGLKINSDDAETPNVKIDGDFNKDVRATLTMEFNISAEEAEYFKKKKNKKALEKHADAPVKALITKAFLRAQKSDHPTNEMIDKYFRDSDAISVKIQKSGKLKVQISVPFELVGFVKDNLEDHPEKFAATQSAIGRELSLIMDQVQHVKKPNARELNAA